MSANRSFSFDSIAIFEKGTTETWTEYIKTDSGGWRRIVTSTSYLDDGTRIISDEAADCTAEDVIISLILAICNEKYSIGVKKGPMGTLILVQSLAPGCATFGQRFNKNFLTSLVGANSLTLD